MSKDFVFNGELAGFDPEVHGLALAESDRQARKLVMIASESLCPEPVRAALSTEFVNLYAEGYPSVRMSERERDRISDHARSLAYYRRYGDRRYYKGVEICDLVETLAQKRCAELFANERVPASGIFANVQPLSGAAANNAVYNSFVQPGDTVMGMALPTGGHLTHGSEFNRSGKNYRIVSYSVSTKTHKLDYDQIADLARRERPKMIIAGFSAYPWAIDWTTFREIADSVGAVLFADIAHPAGLVAGGVYPSPVGIADVITFTTHKTLCGPRGAVILTTSKENSRKADSGVFPGEQGGPHMHMIAGKAVAFKMALTPEFRELQKRVVDNAKALAAGFEKRGFPLAYGGTDTHLLLVDCKKIKTANGGALFADIASRILDLAGITINKNTIVGDDKALQPTGLRFGTTIVSQRGFGALEMDSIAQIVVELLSSSKCYPVQGQKVALGRAKVTAEAFLKARAAVSELEKRGVALSAEYGRKYPYYVAIPSDEPVAKHKVIDAHRKAGAKIETADRRETVLHFGKPDEEKKALSSGAVAADCSDMAHFMVRGERAPAFLNAALSMDAISLKPGNGCDGFVPAADGSVLDLAVLLRLDDSGYGEARYVLRVPGRKANVIADWLRALSDGFVEIGAADVFAKVEGPVVIEDAGWTSFTVAGPKAESIVSGKAAAGKLAGLGAFVVRAADGRHEIMVPDSAAAAAFAALSEAGAKPAGKAVRDAIPGANLPGKNSIAEVAASAKGSFAGWKTFHVGVAAAPSAGKSEALPAFAHKADELPLRRTPLFDEHLKLTKKRNVIPFAGWEMPVVYTSISDEHKAVRERAGLFDVAHMGVFEFSGPNAARALDLMTSNYVPRLRVGESHYGYLLAPDGSCIDDLMIYRVGEQIYMVVVNASNAEKDWAWLNAYNSGKYAIDLTRPWARVEVPAVIRNLKDPSSGADMKVDMALQGPAALPTILKAANPKDRAALIGLARNCNAHATLDAMPVIVSRTGYTGEICGYEIYVHPDKAVALWNALLDRGREFGVQPTGLGARDSTRTEAGLPLYGHDLAGHYDIDPIEAGYGNFVKWHKPFFAGRAKLLDRTLNQKREVVRFCAKGIGARVANLGDPVVSRTGKAIGFVTSAALSGEEQIGLAIVEKGAAAEGTPVSLYCIPRTGSTPDEANKKALKPGDKVLLPLEAKVISRFMPAKG